MKTKRASFEAQRLFVVLILSCCFVELNAAPARAAQAPPPDCGWSVVPSRNTGSPHNAFNGVAAIASNDVWAVGSYDVFGLQPWQLIQHWDGAEWSIAAPLDTPGELTAISAVSTNDVWAVGGAGGLALARHWNGASWSTVPTANPGTGMGTRFHGVAAVSSQNVWAVGRIGGSGLSGTLVERWNGASWSIVASPNVPNQHNHLNAITAVPGSPNELWAVGDGGPHGIIVHWDGAQWSLVPSPSPWINSHLTGVTAVSANDVWAVGWAGTTSGTISITLHWNGSTWSVVPSPSPSSTYNYLWGVSARAANDVWAVGDYNATGGHGRTLIVRWNGSTWSHLAGDDAGPIGLAFSLNAISALNSGNVWAVGTNSHALAEHWNGAQWSIVSAPNAGVASNIPNDVSGTSASDVWQVGHYVFGTENKTLIEHWDGVAWHFVPSPNTNKRLNTLNGVDAFSPTDAWAVGSASSGGIDQTTLVMRWNGGSWSILPSPSPGTFGLNELNAVAALSATDVWAVGNFTDVGEYSETLIEHWNGATWSVVPSPNLSGVNNALFDIVALAANDIWAVGYGGVSSFGSLAVHWDGSTWSIVPTPGLPVSSGVLLSVSATGPNDVWAVGTATNLLTNKSHGFVQHWDGTSWSNVLGLATESSTWNAVAAVSPADVWAVGDIGGSASIARWDGSLWKLFPSPGVAARLLGVTAITPADVWTVGQRYEPSIAYFQTLAEHFDCDIERFCFCEDGGGCFNPDTTAGCANSTGVGALLSRTSGSSSVSQDDLVLSVAQLPTNKTALTFMGSTTTNLPFFDGRRCVAAGSFGLFRYPPQTTGATGATTLGPGIVAHSQGFPPSGVIQAGSTWYFQNWYRDPSGPCGQGTNLSNAARVTFEP